MFALDVKIGTLSIIGAFSFKKSHVKIIQINMSMYTGRLVVRVHYAYAEVYNWSLAAKTILKIAYNQSAMGFFFLAVIWSGYFKKYVLKTGQTF